MTPKEYISEVNKQFQTGVAREHAYRPALQQLMTTLLQKFVTTNEPARIECGAPDFIIAQTSSNIPVAFIEAKDIDDNDLDGRHQHREQFDRYKASLDHIVFTDYLDFHFYDFGQLSDTVRIGEIHGDKIVFQPDTEAKFDDLIQHLATASPQKIESAQKLAMQMATKARMLAEIIRNALKEENKSQDNQQLEGEYEAFKRVLINDITSDEFADIYAQTIAYGMFAARLHDDSPENFSRQEAANLIPKTNPFLRQIFQLIAGYDLDERISWIVDDLAETFAQTNIEKIMDVYGADQRHEDPMVHFYEDFLSAYDPKLRKSRGVWYTPQPVVNFIVRAVDDILKQDFGLPLGLADYSTIEKDCIVEQGGYDKHTSDHLQHEKRKFHKVQILDPATGTGTFLAEAVKQIYAKFDCQQGMWQSYVEDNLLPRLNGFEILMASYAVAHLKLDMLLKQTGYVPTKDRRLQVYLTNSLEECHPDTGTLFAQSLSNEANAANRVKRDTPVMVMMGNPPYSGESQNKGKWIMDLLETYKKEPGGNTPLNERNPKWINDDYVKFIRMAQYFIEKNGEGIIAYINPHGYLDNPTFRGMRWNLLKTFDKIYTIDLHGNSKKKEVCPDGSKDENVFDIMQGVSINIFVKNNKKSANELGKVFHADLWGLRDQKYEYLTTHKFAEVPYTEVHPSSNMYFFVPKDFKTENEYNSGFSINQLFTINSVGIVTTKDSFLICDSKDEVKLRINELIHLSDNDLLNKYSLKDTRDWSLARAREDVGETVNDSCIVQISYRPFDTKYLYYTGKTNGIVARPRYHSLVHLLDSRNIGILSCRQLAGNLWSHISITNHIVDDCRVSNRTKERGYVFPLFLSGEASKNSLKNDLVPNLNPEIIKAIEEGLGEQVVPLELFDYIYGVLHCPEYREKYKEFLKIDFPRIPYPKNPAKYHEIAAKGTELRKLHLLEDSVNWHLITKYPEAGDNAVDGIEYRDNRVYINKTQYFEGVTPEVWNFFIGGYQPAQKWLKDRKGRTLSFADIRHYQEMIVALSGTEEIMKTISL
jgi:predicted helicase